MKFGSCLALFKTKVLKRDISCGYFLFISNNIIQSKDNAVTKATNSERDNTNKETFVTDISPIGTPAC